MDLLHLIIGRRGQTEEDGTAKRVFGRVLRRGEDPIGE
jgi:hypothetical protein